MQRFFFHDGSSPSTLSSFLTFQSDLIEDLGVTLRPRAALVSRVIYRNGTMHHHDSLPFAKPSTLVKLIP